MDRESAPEASPEHIEETTRGVVENAQEELRELKRMLLLSKLREMKDPWLKTTDSPEKRQDAEARACAGKE